jgi:hypothetical protein
LLNSQIKERTKQAKYPSYCADLWKSNGNAYFVGITFQFIDGEWTLHNLPIAFCPVVGPHTAEAVGNLIADQLGNFDESE